MSQQAHNANLCIVSPIPAPNRKYGPEYWLQAYLLETNAEQI